MIDFYLNAYSAQIEECVFLEIEGYSISWKIEKYDYSAEQMV